MLPKLDFGQLSYNNQTILMKVPVITDPFKTIMVSVSGGSDSDVVVDMCERMIKDKSKLHYVYFDTGLEYKATKDHLVFLEDKYSISIERVKAIKSIPYTAKEYGQPFISKHVSEMCYRLQKYGFEWDDAPYQELIKDYPNCESALKWWTNYYDIGSSFNISRNKMLKEFMVDNPPWFKISAKCCEYAKKRVASEYEKEYAIDLSVNGMRKAEGGVRSTRYSSCFDKKDGVSQYRIIYNMTDQDKINYTQVAHIENSNCYTKYGLLRTGCAGCPFSKNLEMERQVIANFEPTLLKAVENTFRDSYEYTKMYREYIQEFS